MKEEIRSRTVIFNTLVISEAVLLLTATIWCRISQIDLIPYLNHCNRWLFIYGIAAGLITTAFGLLMLLAGGRLGSRVNWLAQTRKIVLQEVQPLFVSFNFIDILLVSATSGFCEEVFFRGVLQAQFGMLPAGLLFAAFHSPTLQHLPYGLWSLAAGLLFGYCLQATHSLWTCVLAHTLNNLLSMIYLRYIYKAEGR